MNEKFEQFLSKLKETLSQQYQATLERPWAISLREKYENLTPRAQKAFKVATTLLLALFFLYMPLSYFMDSFDQMSQFEEKRSTIKELLKVSRELQTAPMVPFAPTSGMLRAQLSTKLRETGITDDQVKKTEEINSTKGKVKEDGLSVTIEKITVKQMLDLSFALESSSSATKLSQMEIRARDDDPHYYNVVFKVVGYSPQTAALPSVSDVLKSGKGKTPIGGKEPGDVGKQDLEKESEL